MATIRCAVCNKPVETITWYDHPMAQVRVIQVTCHNDLDQMILSFHSLEKYGKEMEHIEGVAFSDKRLEMKNGQ